MSLVDDVETLKIFAKTPEFIVFFGHSCREADFCGAGCWVDGIKKSPLEIICRAERVNRTTSEFMLLKVHEC